jgi:hypothetical protein
MGQKNDDFYADLKKNNYFVTKCPPKRALHKIIKWFLILTPFLGWGILKRRKKIILSQGPFSIF